MGDTRTHTATIDNEGMLCLGLGVGSKLSSYAHGAALGPW